MPFDVGIIGRYLIFFGAVVVIVGVVLMMAGKFPGLKIGRLPGDFYFERGNYRFYFPLMTSILLSLIFTFILWLINRR